MAKQHWGRSDVISGHLPTNLGISFDLGIFLRIDMNINCWPILFDVSCRHCRRQTQQAEIAVTISWPPGTRRGITLWRHIYKSYKNITVFRFLYKKKRINQTKWHSKITCHYLLGSRILESVPRYASVVCWSRPIDF